MNTLVVYDSRYGNTETIAKAIAAVLPGEVKLRQVSQVLPGDLPEVELLLLGSPTHGGLPTEAMRGLLDRLGGPAGAGARAATFDTRLTWGFLPREAFAAIQMANTLRAKGWPLAGPPGGFFVRTFKRKKALKRGELERAVAWAKEVCRT